MFSWLVWPSLADLLRRNFGDAEAQAVAAVFGLVGAARRRAAAIRRGVPATVAFHAVRARCRPRRIVRGRIRIVTAIIPVLAPLPYVPVHVVQPPGIRLLLAHRVRLAARVRLVPRIFAQPRLIVPEAVSRRAPRAAGIFPLGFGGQLELASARRLRVQLAEETAGNRPN